jgi:uncharacterized protein YodC (DUF2158 family)
MENKDQLKAGDVVYLKSGSHGMTISSITNNEASCYWVAVEEVKYSMIPLSVLTKEEPKNKEN